MKMKSKRVNLLRGVLGVAFLSIATNVHAAPSAVDIQASKLLSQASEIYAKNAKDITKAENYAAQAYSLINTLPRIDQNRLRVLSQIEQFYFQAQDYSKAQQISKELDQDIDSVLKRTASQSDLNVCLRSLSERVGNDTLNNSHLIGRKLPPAVFEKSLNLHKRMEAVLDRLSNSEIDKGRLYRDVQNFYRNNNMTADEHRLAVKQDASVKAYWQAREKNSKSFKQPCLGCGRG